jgi:hypothetical protein
MLELQYLHKKPKNEINNITVKERGFLDVTCITSATRERDAGM